MKTFLLFCSLIAGSSIGEVLSARGMQQVGDISFAPRALLHSFLRMLRNPYLFAGVGCLALSFFSFISLLSYADLSFVVPLTAIGYITNTIGAKFFLKERISKERWAGTLLVTIGVTIISLDSQIGPMVCNGWQALSQILAPESSLPRGISPFLLWFLVALRAGLFTLILTSLTFYLISFAAGLLWFADRKKQRALGLEFTPPVTIFKPVRGLDKEAYLNLASFCRQDYPEYQLLFGVRDNDDPVVPVIRQLMADFPQRDIQLVISEKDAGHNAKVSNLLNLYPQAKNDIFLIADSDIRVTPDYLRRVVAPLQQAQVGMVTCLYRGVNPKTFADLLENIGISSTFGPEVCSARALEGISFALGSTIVLRREILEKIGGFSAIADYLVDDFILGSRTTREGYKIVLSDCVVDHVSGMNSLGAMLKHQLRWGRSMRISRPWGYRGLILTYGTSIALLALPVWNFSRFAWSILGLTILTRFFPIALIGVYGLKDFNLARFFWLVPVRDLLAFCIWIASLGGDVVEWRGKKFHVLPDGKLIEARIPPIASEFHSVNAIMNKDQ